MTAPADDERVRQRRRPRRQPGHGSRRRAPCRRRGTRAPRRRVAAAPRLRAAPGRQPRSSWRTIVVGSGKPGGGGGAGVPGRTVVGDDQLTRSSDRVRRARRTSGPGTPAARSRARRRRPRRGGRRRRGRRSRSQRLPGTQVRRVPTAGRPLIRRSRPYSARWAPATASIAAPPGRDRVPRRRAARPGPGGSPPPARRARTRSTSPGSWRGQLGDEAVARRRADGARRRAMCRATPTPRRRAPGRRARRRCATAPANASSSRNPVTRKDRPAAAATARRRADQVVVPRAGPTEGDDARRRRAARAIAASTSSWPLPG